MPSRFIRSQRVRNTPADLAKYLAYNARCAVQLGRDSKRFDYGDRTDHAAGGTIYPESLEAFPPERVRMWQALQAGAHGNTEWIATALMAVLPRANELTAPERSALIEEFCTPIRDVGHIIDWQMHRGRKGNWHVHFLISACGMSRDEQTEALPDSPFRVAAPWSKDSKTGEKKPYVINPPWQRMWRVAQERFFRRRQIDLRVPASTAIIRQATRNQSPIELRPASSRGYASDAQVTEWRARRRKFFSDPSFYLAALTRDRLIIDRHDIDTFNTMIWGEHAIPEPIERLFRSNHMHQPPEFERVGGGRAVRFGNGTVTSRESFALLYRAMRAARYLDHAPFIDQGELIDEDIAAEVMDPEIDDSEYEDADDESEPSINPGSRFRGVACTGSIGMVSAAKPEHLLRVGKNGFEHTSPVGLDELAGLEGLVPILDRATQHVELLFIAADHISYRRYDDALKKRKWRLIGISEFLKSKFANAFLSNETYRRRGVMLVVLDAQRISDPRLAALICIAEKLQRGIGRLRLLLMKAGDVTAEPNAPLLDWLSRSLRHHHLPDPVSRDYAVIERADARNTFDARFCGGPRATRESDLMFDDLPPEVTRYGASRQARHKAALAHLSKPGALQKNPKSPSHPLIIVGSRPDMHISGRGRLQPGDRVLVTQDLPDEGLSAGTILTIGDGDGESRAFFYCDPGGNGQNAIDAKLAHHFLPIDMMSVRDAFQIVDHLDAIRAQGNYEVFVIVSDRDHAESLLTLASSLDRRLCKIIIDKNLCSTPAQLMTLIDQSPFNDALDTLAGLIDAKPKIAALHRNDPDSYDAIVAASETFGLEGQPMDDAIVAPEPQAQILAADEAPPHADGYDDAFDFEALAGADFAEDDFDYEDDPDVPIPEIWNEDDNFEPDDEPGTDNDNSDEPDR
ncbi:MAG: MobA/MobL family protein [Salinarimonas sp.]